MVHADIAQVLEVDRESYPMPWPASAYRRELNNNTHARYVVLRQLPDSDVAPSEEPTPERRTWWNLLGWPRSSTSDGSRTRGLVIGYAGMWLVADEAHVTTIAVRTSHRGNGFGELLLASLIAAAHDVGARWVTLEVRLTNDIAQALYRKYGFRKAGVRKRYYSDNNEDALIMTTDDITLNAYQAQFKDLVGTLMQRLNAQPGIKTMAPILTPMS